jgi:hypothetical protein
VARLIDRILSPPFSSTGRPDTPQKRFAVRTALLTSALCILVTLFLMVRYDGSVSEPRLFQIYDIEDKLVDPQPDVDLIFHGQDTALVGPHLWTLTTKGLLRTTIAEGKTESRWPLKGKQRKVVDFVPAPDGSLGIVLKDGSLAVAGEKGWTLPPTSWAPDGVYLALTQVL